MIQFNLLPDVKQQYVKARRTNRLVMLASLAVSGAAIFVLLLMITTVDVVQKKSLHDLNGDVTKYSKQLKAVPDLDKILTVQNQLTTLTSLHDKKVVTSRLFGYIAQVTPGQASISKLTVSFVDGTSTISIQGEAPSLDVVNGFADTLKSTTYLSCSAQDWSVDTDYSKGDAVIENGQVFVATSDHKSDSSTEPVVGSNWNDKWKAEPLQCDAQDWQPGLDYLKGDFVLRNSTAYTAATDNTSDFNTEPGVGRNWRDKWKVAPSAFSKVVLTNFGRDSKGATYTIDFEYDPLIFDSANQVKLSVPAGANGAQALLFQKKAGT